jgi:Protein of unknown function (DUF3352)
VFGRRPLHRALLGLAALGAGPLGLSGCGGDGSSGPASLVPPDAPVYVAATIRPDGERAEAISSISETITGIDDPGGRVIALLDRELSDEGIELTYAEDIEPWLGESGAIFVRSLEPSTIASAMPDMAAILETTDPDAAQAFVDRVVEGDPEIQEEERSYEDADYVLDPGEDLAVGIVGDHLVVGTEASFKAAVDAAAGESLAEADHFSQELGEAEEDQLASIWVDLGVALDAAAGSAHADEAEIDAARAALGPILQEPVAMRLAAGPDTVTVDTSGAGDTGIEGDSALLGELPASAWFAIAVADASEALSQTLDAVGSLGAELGDDSLHPDALSAAVEAETGVDLEDDVLPWIGDASAFVAGTPGSEFAAGAIVATTDPDASANAIAAARTAFERGTGRRMGPPRLEGADAGFAALSPFGQGLELALRDDRVVAALGGANAGTDAIDPPETLGGSALFEDALEALGDEHQAAAFLGLQDALVVAEAGDDDGSPDYDAIRPFTDALAYLIYGTAREDERELGRVVLGLGE